VSYSFLDQSYTWSRLQICEEHFRKLFTCLKVHPNFLDIVHVFFEKVRPVEESFNGFFINHSDQHVRGSPAVNNQDSSYSMRLFSSLVYADLIRQVLDTMSNTSPGTVGQPQKIPSLSEKSASINTILRSTRSAAGSSCRHLSNFKTG
jgi:hypothetical protein